MSILVEKEDGDDRSNRPVLSLPDVFQLFFDRLG